MKIIVFPRLINDNHKKKIENSLSNLFDLTMINEQPTEEMLKDADIIWGNPQPKLLAHCKNLKLLQLMSAGTDGYVDSIPAGAHLTNSTGAFGLAISEHMLAVLLMLMKNLHLYHNNQKEHLWKDEGAITSIHGARVLILGLGDIGGDFAKRIHALGGYTVGIRRVGKDKPDYLDELHGSDKIDEELKKADIIAMSLPNTKETKGIINEERINSMKKGAFIINVGRGEAIDQPALIKALNSSHLAGAGLDVVTPEPLPKDNKLWDAKNILITPHISGGDHLLDTLNKIVDIGIYNALAIKNKTPLKNDVDFSTGYRKL